MEDLLAGAEQEMPTLRRGEVVAGVIAAVDRDGILVDIGLKSEGIIPGFEAQRLIEADQVHVDDEVLVLVIQLEDEEGRAILSLSRARAEKSWRTVQRQFEEGEMLEAEVVDHNRGGLIVDADGVRGFVPMSQVAGLHVTGVGEDEIRQQLAEMLHHRISVKVLEVNRRRSRLILSERAVVQERRSQRKEELLAELREGEIRHGRVTSLTEFGAFIDLGGADGLVHLSELSWKPVSHPREVLKVGEEVDVRVLMIDREKKKIALSLRRTQPEPWTTAAERYKPGDLVTGTITKLAAFGAFARLEEGIEGLIHVSELAEGRVTHPRNVVNEGDVLTLRVLRVDPSRRRLGLSLRQVTNPEFVVDESRSEDAGHAEHGVHHKDTKG
ncbi:MAG: S1 RNA-binding domain-containing protein [Chloroflexi bacterium]|nr:S1 RNA-binding domain-containing protein [Chloroflexota bacterium]